MEVTQQWKQNKTNKTKKSTNHTKVLFEYLEQNKIQNHWI